MLKTVFVLMAALTMVTAANAQDVYMTRTGHISFFSSTPIEDIEANNYQVSSSLNTTTGEMAFVVLMKSFEFEKAKMQEDFNADYLHTDEFPKATFSGKITNLEDVDFTKNGTYTVTVTGTMVIHGVSKEVTGTGTLTVNGDTITGISKLDIALDDYDISGPSIANNKVAKVIAVTVNMEYKPK
jgi:polyisoprenoid-binding protein YceI